MIFDGRRFQRQRADILRHKLSNLQLTASRTLSLASFYFTGDEASKTYTHLKEKMAQELGIRFVKFGMDIQSNEDINRLVDLIKLESTKVDGVLVQKPSSVITILGHHRDEVFYRLAAAVPVEKDVDVVSPTSIGRLVMINNPLKFLWPATVRAIFWILTVALEVYKPKADDPFKLMDETRVLESKRVGVVGSRGMVGSLVSLALTSFGAKVMGGDKGVDIKSLVSEAEIVISSTGVPELIKTDWVRSNQMIIDVGFGHKDGKLRGDFQPSAYEKARFAAGVPGGVGPLTVISLMENLVIGT